MLLDARKYSLARSAAKQRRLDPLPGLDYHASHRETAARGCLIGRLLEHAGPLIPL